jgi:hypothetical protein
MNSLFIITSCINNLPGRGVFSHGERYEQTFDTIESIKRLAPGAKIVIADDSIEPLSDGWMYNLSSKVDNFISFKEHFDIQRLSKMGQQSYAECILMLELFKSLQDGVILPDFKSDRIFKITGRCSLDDGFDLGNYSNLSDCFVFKKRVQSWMRSDISLLDTRLWSFSSSLLSDAAEMYQKMTWYINQGFDLEHASFACVPQEKLVEFDRVYLKGRVASDGTWRYD